MFIAETAVAKIKCGNSCLRISRGDEYSIAESTPVKIPVRTGTKNKGCKKQGQVVLFIHNYRSLKIQKRLQRLLFVVQDFPAIFHQTPKPMHYKGFFAATAALFLLAGCHSARLNQKGSSAIKQMALQDAKDAAVQYQILAKNRPVGKFPKTWYDDKQQYEFSNSGWWCSGFYPGTLLYLAELTKDESLTTEAHRAMDSLAREQFNTRTHDLGFMMYCSFGNDYRLHPTDATRAILLNSARSLATRFNPNVGCIRSWNSKSGEFLVIIDNMMNLELLFWATKATGDSSFYRIAVTHANTTMKNHFRDDYSSYHVLNYDSATGAVIQKRTAQGASDQSAWARGQAWGLYGYTMVYRETGDTKYLDQAMHIANFILHHPRLPADGIPYWDFDAKGIPNALRDASAGSVMASALLELARYAPANASREYLAAAERILQTLSSGTYKAAPGTNGGFLIRHGVGNMPSKTEIDVPLSYGDYYYVEALQRYLHWY